MRNFDPCAKNACMRFFAVLIFVIAISTPFSAATASCRLALVLALDVSGSVNEEEYAQQLSGLAQALDSPEVRDAILTGAAVPVKLAVFEWSSRNHQFLVQPWITLNSHASIDQAVAGILSYRKQRAGLKTAMSTALLFAADLLRQQSECWQHTIDVSGDGENNIGPSLSAVYGTDLFADVTINALVVGNAQSEDDTSKQAAKKAALLTYFEQNVIRGRDAFAMIAHGYRDYSRAMKRKLTREISAPIIGQSTQP